jgi:branched-subunit amino acid ABC-type transport system permease component
MDWIPHNFITFIDGITFGLLLFTIAIGLSLVVGVLNVLNLAHGALYLVGTDIAVQFLTGPTPSMWGYVAALGVAVAIGGGAGTGLAVMMRPLANRSHLDQALLTLGLAFVITDLLSARYGNTVYTVAPPRGVGGSTNFIGFVYPNYRLAVIAAGLLLALVVYLVVDRTRLGALTRATVADAQMVRAMGIDTRPLVALVFAFGAILACVGGLLGAPILGAYPGLDQYVLILGLVVVVLGGAHSVGAGLTGALLIGQAEVLGVALVPRYASFLVFATMVVVVLVRSGNRAEAATS